MRLAVGTSSDADNLKILDVQFELRKLFLKELHSLKGHGQAVTALAFSADGQRLAVASSDRSYLVSLWDVAGPTPRKITDLSGHHGSVGALVWSRDRSFLVSGASDLTVRIWDVSGNSGRQRFALRGHTASIFGIAFAPDRPLLATNGAGIRASLLPGSFTTGAETTAVLMEATARSMLSEEVKGGLEQTTPNGAESVNIGPLPWKARPI